MAIAYFKIDDRMVLDNLIGNALLYEEICESLLRRETRAQVLQRYPLSFATVEHLLSLADVPSIHDLAAQIYEEFPSVG